MIYTVYDRLFLLSYSNMTVNVKIMRLNETVRLPRKASEYAAGFDLYSNDKENIIIKPGEKKFIHTGLIMEIPIGYAGFIYTRSGFGCDCVSVIDSDYRGEVMVCLHNHGTEDFEIRKQYNIAQIVFMKVPDVELVEVTDTNISSGDFGSTGI